MQTLPAAANENQSGVRGELITCAGCMYSLHYSAVRVSEVQCGAVQFGAVQCSAVRCSSVQCSAVQYIYLYFMCTLYIYKGEDGRIEAFAFCIALLGIVALI